MSLGRELSDQEWVQRKSEYVGAVVRPTEPILDFRRCKHNLQIMLHLWHNPIWQRLQQEVSQMGKKLCKLP